MAEEGAFSGSIPAIYDRFMGPMLFEPYARELAGRFSRFSGSLLETAAGTGRVTRALAATVGDDATIVATDLSEPMLAKAAQAVHDPRVALRQADACELPFADCAFDGILCQFGVMFFPDKVRAFTEARRVLRPGGSFVFSVWDDIEENELCLAFHRAIAACFPDDPPQFLLKGPFSYHDRGVIEAQLKAAGWRDIAFETVRLETPSPSAADAAFGLCNGSPLVAEFQARGPARQDEVVGAVESAFRKQFGDGPLHPVGQAVVVTAAAESREAGSASDCIRDDAATGEGGA
jgi:ubiquinone/menaquinone biosynthesis C-methylase UbiE